MNGRDIVEPGETIVFKDAIPAKVSAFPAATQNIATINNLGCKYLIQLPSMDTDNLLSLLHLLPVGIFLVNREDRIIWINKTLCEQTGLKQGN